MSAHPSSGDKPPPPSHELQAVTAKLEVYQRENLDYTDAANTPPPKLTRAQRRWRALQRAFYYWVHSRF